MSDIDWNLGVTGFTRLVISLSYLGLVLIIYRDRMKMPPKKRPARAFLAVVCLSWAIWYMALALLDPPPYPWGSLTRALHLPLVAALAVNLWSADLWRKKWPDGDNGKDE